MKRSINLALFAFFAVAVGTCMALLLAKAEFAPAFPVYAGEDDFTLRANIEDTHRFHS